MSNSEISQEEPLVQRGRTGLWRIAPERTAMRLLAKLLHRLVRNGQLTLIDTYGETWRFGPFSDDLHEQP
jgi:hypothetical protein